MAPKPSQVVLFMNPAVSLYEDTMASGLIQEDSREWLCYGCSPHHYLSLAAVLRRGFLLRWPVCDEAASVEGRIEEGSRSHTMVPTESIEQDCHSCSLRRGSFTELYEFLFL